MDIGFIMAISEAGLQFCEAIVFLYKNSGFESQKALALTAGVSPSIINDIIKKRKAFGPKTQEKVAKALGENLISALSLGRRLLKNPKKKTTNMKPLPTMIKTYSLEDHKKTAKILQAISVYVQGLSQSVYPDKIIELSLSAHDSILQLRSEMEEIIYAEYDVDHDDVVEIFYGENDFKLKQAFDKKDALNTNDERLKMTIEILASNTEFAYSLDANIRSFHNAVINQKRIDGLENKVDGLEQTVAALMRNNSKKNDRRKRDKPVDPDRRSGADRRTGN